MLALEIGYDTRHYETLGSGPSKYPADTTRQELHPISEMLGFNKPKNKVYKCTTSPALERNLRAFFHLEILSRSRSPDPKEG